VNVVAALGVLAGVLAGCGGSAADEPSAASTSLPPLAPLDPEASVTSLAGQAAPVTPEGFDTVYVRVTDANGEVCERCMWLATTSEQRARGLMGVTDLGGPAGMVFAYSDPAVRRFWMKSTLLPLSIAFADASGVVVGTADMDPCTADPCPNYGPDAPSTLAVEVPQGALDELGLVEGSTVEVIGDCPVGSG